MDIAEIAYLAGIIDGEGCISIAWRYPDKKRDYRYTTPTLQISNTDYRLIDWLITNIGGNTYYQRDKRMTRKPSWNWSIAGRKAIDIIRTVRPYLKLKTEQADIVLGLDRVTAVQRDKSGRLQPTLTDERKQADMKAVERIRALNRRGESTSVASDAFP